ncbi:MAG TPA: hypothetical protein VIG64_10905 [Actinomycetota bacterium]
MSQAPPPLESDIEIVQWMLFGGNIAEAEREEFFSELEGFRHRERTSETEQEFRRWLTSWMVSIRLHMDEDYQRQRTESLARYNGGEAGVVVGKDGLRQRFSA